jgi:hypothetical protein
MVRQYEKQENEKMEASRKIKMDAAQGSFMKNIAQIQHGNIYNSEMGLKINLFLNVSFEDWEGA